MITPGYGLTATERVLPRMALDFTTAVTDPRVTTTRALNTATRINSSGVIELVNANLPRYDFDPVTKICRGQLIEEARTNLFLNSLINGTNLATQSVTLTAVAHTLSFYGSGSVAISGGHTATVAGTGDYPSRRTYTFTPTAGSSTFTVTGDVKYAQVEIGAFASSFIPTAGTSTLRNPDDVNMTGTNFTSWYNFSEGSFVAEGISAVTQTSALFSIEDGTTINRIQATLNASAQPTFTVVDNSAAQAVLTQAATTPNTLVKIAAAFKASSFAISSQGLVATTLASGIVPQAVTLAQIGNRFLFNYLNGPIRSIRYYPQRLLDAELRALSK
jgi:hypothetical protein